MIKCENCGDLVEKDFARIIDDKEVCDDCYEELAIEQYEWEKERDMQERDYQNGSGVF